MDKEKKIIQETKQKYHSLADFNNKLRQHTDPLLEVGWSRFMWWSNSNFAGGGSKDDDMEAVQEVDMVEVVEDVVETVEVEVVEAVRLWSSRWS